MLESTDHQGDHERLSIKRNGPSAEQADRAKAQMAHRVDEFARRLVSMRRQAAALRAHLEDVQARHLIPEQLLAEILATLEELHVAEEEMYQQHQEISETRHQLELERVRYQELFDYAPEGYVVTDGSGMIRDANAAAAELFGIPVSALCRKPLPTLVDEGDRARVRAVLNAGRPTKPGEEWLIKMSPRGGSVLNVAVRMSPVRDSEAQAIVGARWMLRDVTERLRVEDELRRLNEQLEQRVTERTEELTRRTQEVEAANQAKSQFLASMSHEIRTPVNAILGYADLLEIGVAGEPTPAQRDYLQRQRASGRHLMRLIDDLLDMARIEAGRVEMAITRASAKETVGGAMELVRPEAAARAIELSAHVEPDDLHYRGDEARVRQILANLVNNAIKFTHEGGRVHVQAEEIAEPDPAVSCGGASACVRFAISDSGEGIAPERQSAMFEPFVQGESVYTRVHGGAGLGLPISQRLAWLMDGEITLDSRRGEGSTFMLWLPADSGVLAERVHGSAGTGDEVETPSRMVRAGRRVLSAAAEVVDNYVRGIRNNRHFAAFSARDDATLAGHAPTLIAELAQSLLLRGSSDGDVSAELRAASALQRAIAERHGAQRARLGWPEHGIRAEMDILRGAVISSLERGAAEMAFPSPSILAVIATMFDQLWRSALVGFRTASPATDKSKHASGGRG